MNNVMKFIVFCLICCLCGCSTPVSFYIINNSVIPYLIELKLADRPYLIGDLIQYMTTEQDWLSFIPKTLEIAGFKNKQQIFRGNISWHLIDRTALVYNPDEKKISFFLEPQTVFLLQRDNNKAEINYYDTIILKPVKDKNPESIRESIVIPSDRFPDYFSRQKINSFFLFHTGDIFYLEL